MDDKNNKNLKDVEDVVSEETEEITAVKKEAKTTTKEKVKSVSKNNGDDLVKDLPKAKSKEKDKSPVKIKEDERKSIIESLQNKALKKKSRRNKAIGFFVFIIIILLCVFGYFMYTEYIKPTIGKGKENTIDEPIVPETALEKLNKLGYEELELKSTKELTDSFELKEFDKKDSYTKDEIKYTTMLESGTYKITIGEETKELLTNVKYVTPIFEDKDKNTIYQFVYNNIDEVYILQDSIDSTKEYTFKSLTSIESLESILYYTPNKIDYYFFAKSGDKYKYLLNTNDEKISNITLKNIDDIAYVKFSSKIVINKDKTIIIDGEEIEDNKCLAVLLDSNNNVNVIILEDMTIMSGIKATETKVTNIFTSSNGMALLFDDDTYNEYQENKLAQ